MTILSGIKLIGTTVTTTAEFRDSHKVKIFPIGVTLKYKTPIGTIISMNIPPISGIYSSNILLDVPGLWNFRWECSGEYATAQEFPINVVDTSVK